MLHTTVRRNEYLARLFHDLRLMEREGSGYDKIYEVLLSHGRPAPNWSMVTIECKWPAQRSGASVG
ncbi:MULTISPECIES: ATP-binding protein [Sinorhizobium/Ensifer group]|uniref:ATP-binding protein n=1 Tax=Sinorhizobium/Ensifer group TaxID=227292 RepID=UPI00071CCD09|nr:ATP-binding protein [Sinorhizobium sp. Sb3]